MDLKARREPAQGYVLAPSEGEHLVRGGAQAAQRGGDAAPNDGGSIWIKVDPSRDSGSMSLGTQHLPVGAGIRVHRHLGSDEVLFVLDGVGYGILGDTRAALDKGSCMYIPRGSWHGIENPDSALELLWVVAPPGLEGLMRDVASPAGSPPRPLTLEQLNEISRRHGQEFR
jgi:mannose-6-phosphate isomerase-like protein (cupin superfamily)